MQGRVKVESSDIDPEKADNFVSMLANSSKKQKPARQRPATTSQLSNAVSEEVHHADELLHSFSPEADHFALLFPVLNKHRLCVYDAATGQVVSEHITDDARVTAISWGRLIYNLENDSSQAEKQSPSKKRRKHPDHSAELGSPNKDQGIEVIALGLSSGTTELFSPAHGRVVRSLSDPSLRSAITCVRLRSVISADSRITLACVSTNAGEICTWNASQNIPMAKWRHDAHKDLSSFEFNPHDETYLAGSTNISLYSLNKRDLISGQPVQPEQINHFSGHANRISGLIWELTKEPRRFVSRSGTDRFLNVWEVPTSQTSPQEGLIVSISMDDNVRHSCLDPNAPPHEQLLFGLTSSGTGALYVLPMAKVQSKTTTPDRTKIRLISGSEVRFEPISATFIRGREGVLRFAFLVGGIRLLIEEVVSCLELGIDLYLDVLLRDSERAMATSSKIL
jgi:U3 small nucleolar RNA-associated protein 5